MMRNRKRSETLEQLRAKTQGAGGSLRSAGTVRYQLMTRRLKHGDTVTEKVYAQVKSCGRSTLNDVAKRMERERGILRAADYREAVSRFFETLADELKEGKTVNVPGVGVFSVSLGGAFDPANPSESRKHALRAHLRFSPGFTNALNKGTRLANVETMPPTAEIDGVLGSCASEEAVTLWNCPRVAEGRVLPGSAVIRLSGTFRKLTESLAVRLTNVATGETFEATLAPPAGGVSHEALLTIGPAWTLLCLGSDWEVAFAYAPDEPLLTFAIR